ncbi:hypothetical protein BH24ACI4_BH24ACI4_11710 [soil metagenome]
MATEVPGAAGGSSRARPLLLFLFAVVAAYLLIQLGGSAGLGQPTSNLPAAQQTAQGSQLDPAVLDVNLEALEGERPPLEETERNPFRFEQRRQPAPPPQAGPRMPEVVPMPGVPAGPPQPPPPPPIAVRFIGQLDREDGSRVAVFVDCTVGRRTSHAQEGGIVDGRYRLISIGLQSVVIEHLDGRGRTTLPQTGQECAGK